MRAARRPRAPCQSARRARVARTTSDRLRPAPGGAGQEDSFTQAVPATGLRPDRHADACRKNALRWYQQGRRDIRSAVNSCRAGDHKWACVQAVQGAEKALKAVLLARGSARVRICSIFELLGEIILFEPAMADLKADAMRLDGISLSTRYPDTPAWELTPSEYFRNEDAEACISSARSICTATGRVLRG